jgi:hypothetical protein
LPTWLVHRLVALAFHDNPFNLPLVDHKNRIRTDARAINLQWASYSTNNMNRAKMDGCTSQYYGVTKQGLKWKAYLTEHGKPVHLGTYETELEACEVYDTYVKENHLSNKINFE